MNDNEETPVTLYFPNGKACLSGSNEDRAAWWQCVKCFRRTPSVGSDTAGQHACMGPRCGGVSLNPKVARVMDRPPWHVRARMWLLGASVL